ncbi:MAG: GNAT family N-acetyltransferase, partial [Actinobacteria bacterium]|nr:GNAT family N-acetyltransferase [Actinomycetota bacterium]
MTANELEPRLFLESDIDAALELNNLNAPAVGEIDRTQLEFLIEHSLYSFAIGADMLHAFCITFAPGAPYTSVNYQWFSQNYSEFVYLDRIVVSEKMRNNSLGAKLYAAVEQRMIKDRCAPILTCEVNLNPPNIGSIRFHNRIGFREVGQQDSKPGLTVSLL